MNKSIIIKQPQLKSRTSPEEEEEDQIEVTRWKVRRSYKINKFDTQSSLACGVVKSPAAATTSSSSKVFGNNFSSVTPRLRLAAGCLFRFHLVFRVARGNLIPETISARASAKQYSRTKSRIVNFQRAGTISSVSDPHIIITLAKFTPRYNSKIPTRACVPRSSSFCDHHERMKGSLVKWPLILRQLGQ